jgi:hypothetical protein
MHVYDVVVEFSLEFAPLLAQKPGKHIFPNAKTYNLAFQISNGRAERVGRPFDN